ncbi:cupin domain-containing protein [Labedella endophytica]|uniref:Cupin domain-containing protein n=1 Tax=Labedella endophytica TaxID=1523160 RepID=A0A3S0V8S2_9MICO|nr:cupin domain-containing protein [Labedella endophytica]RUQ98159.1 cupin domain-containing protein [Labedella endophytica]
MTDEKVARRTVGGEIIEWLDVPPRAAALQLEPHPEGGWYRETWRSADPVHTEAGDRPAATLIYFLLPPGEASAWHAVTSDEIWLWHGPGEVALQLGGSGAEPVNTDVLLLGADEAAGQRAQGLVPAGVWQRTLPRASEALVSCLVSPGFSFDDWSLNHAV